jgi:serine/threonine-protein kinase RsbW
MEATFRLEADVDQLKDARQFVEETAARFHVAPEAISKLVLAVDELITNLIVHGYDGQPGSIEVEMRSIGSDLEIRLYDQSPPFDPTRVPAPDTRLPLDERPLGGMGIYLARKIMDSLTYRAATERGNELTLIKKAIIQVK